jgi:hypothetical protein
MCLEKIQIAHYKREQTGFGKSKYNETSNDKKNAINDGNSAAFHLDSTAAIVCWLLPYGPALTYSFHITPNKFWDAQLLYSISSKLSIDIHLKKGIRKNQWVQCYWKMTDPHVCAKNSRFAISESCRHWFG